MQFSLCLAAPPTGLLSRPVLSLGSRQNPRRALGLPLHSAPPAPRPPGLALPILSGNWHRGLSLPCVSLSPESKPKPRP